MPGKEGAWEGKERREKNRREDSTNLEPSRTNLQETVTRPALPFSCAASRVLPFGAAA